MSQRSSAAARAIAVLALLCGFVVVIAIVSASLGGDGDEGSGRKPAAAKAAKGDGRDASEEPPQAYVVQNGDTLTSIAHRTGVSVSRIQELNPGVDPQILVSGEKLKLR